MNEKYSKAYGESTQAKHTKKDEWNRKERKGRKNHYFYVIFAFLAVKLFSVDLYRQAAHARSNHPNRKATPPIGVIAPSQRIPVKLRM